MSFAQTTFLANLTRDPEVRVTPKGTSICQFGIAVNRTYKDESGSNKEEVSFFDIEAWGKQADTIGKYLSKGKPIFCICRPRLDSWDDKTTGQKRSKVKFVLESFQFVGGKDGDRQQNQGAENDGNAPARQPSRQAPAPLDDDSQIPF